MSDITAAKQAIEPMGTLDAKSNLFQWLTELFDKIRNSQGNFNDVLQYTRALYIKDAPIVQVPAAAAAGNAEREKTLSKITGFMMTFIKYLPTSILNRNLAPGGGRNLLYVLADNHQVTDLRDAILRSHQANYPPAVRLSNLNKKIQNLHYVDYDPLDIVTNNIVNLMNDIHDTCDGPTAIITNDSLLAKCRHLFYDSKVPGLTSLAKVLVTAPNLMDYVHGLIEMDLDTARSGIIKPKIPTPVTAMLTSTEALATTTATTIKPKRPRQNANANDTVPNEDVPVCEYCRVAKHWLKNAPRHPANDCRANPASPSYRPPGPPRQPGDYAKPDWKKARKGDEKA